MFSCRCHSIRYKQTITCEQSGTFQIMTIVKKLIRLGAELGLYKLTSEDLPLELLILEIE